MKHMVAKQHGAPITAFESLKKSTRNPVAADRYIKTAACHYPAWGIVGSSQKAICSAYFYNAASIKGIGTYVNMQRVRPQLFTPVARLVVLGIRQTMLYTMKLF